MRAAAALLAAAVAGGCAGPTPAPAGLLAPREASLAELQVRRYENVRQEEALLAAVAVLQDFGLQVTSSDAAVGLVVAQRGHRVGLEDFGQLLRDAFVASMTTAPWKKPAPHELVRPRGLSAAVTVMPEGRGSAVRISLHRLSTKPTGEPVIQWAEELRDPQPYAVFFEQLSRALAK
jgi:hypothetical protein